MACFADIDVSQGSVATDARCGEIFNIHLTANLPKNLPVKKIVNRLRLDRIMVMRLWPAVLAHHVHVRFFSVLVTLNAVLKFMSITLLAYFSCFSNTLDLRILEILVLSTIFGVKKTTTLRIV